MSAAVSISTMIDQIDGLRDTDDLTEWEQEFVTNVITKYLLAKKDSRIFSGKQTEVIERIWSKHFRG